MVGRLFWEFGVLMVGFGFILFFISLFFKDFGLFFVFKVFFLGMGFLWYISLFVDCCGSFRLLCCVRGDVILDLVVLVDLVFFVLGVDGFLEVGVLGVVVFFVDFGLEFVFFWVGFKDVIIEVGLIVGLFVDVVFGGVIGGGVLFFFWVLDEVVGDK